jgi:hypothetical protein
MKKKLAGCFFLLSFLTGEAQFYNLPGDYAFSLLTQRGLAAPDSSIHAGVKPYVQFFSPKYQFVADSHRIFKFIHDDPALDVVFFKHAIRIEPKHEKFKLRLDPLLNLEIGRDVTKNAQKRLYTNTRGFIGSGYVGDKFYFETLLAENQSLFPDYIAAQSKVSGVVPGQGRWKTYKINGFDYAFSSGFFSIQPNKNLNIQAGHGKQKIGHGYRSLLLSDNSFNYPYARITQQWLKGRVQYTNIYAVLMNLVPASKNITPGAERLFQKKAASFQYLSINVTSRLNVGFFQGLMWQSADEKNRQHLTWQYFNPLIYSNLFAYGLNGKNNILAGADLKIKLTSKVNLYAQVMADRLNTNDSTGAGTGYQVGINCFDALGIRNFFLQAEFNSVGRGSYNNQGITDQSYTHYNQPLAYTPGNGQELILIADYKKRRIFTNIRYNYQTVYTGKKTYAYSNIVNGRLGFLINPSYNLNVSLGINYRLQNFSNFKPFNAETNYIYLSLRTNLYNMYYDF